MSDEVSGGPSANATILTFGPGGISVGGGAELVYNDAGVHEVGGDLIIRVAGRVYIECTDMTVVQHGSVE